MLPKALKSNAAPTIEQGVHEAFAAFDADGSGFISIEELSSALTRPGGGNPLTSAELQAILGEFDASGDGLLSVDEFMEMMIGSGTNPSAPASSLQGGAVTTLKFASKMKKTKAASKSDSLSGKGSAASFSKTSSSSSSKEQGAEALDIDTMLVAIYEEIAALEAEAAALDALAAKSGTLTFERRMGQKLVNLNVSSREEMTELMRNWDTSKDGFISNAEFRYAVRKILKVSADNHEIDKLFEAHDSNDNGKLDMGELKPCLLALQAAVKTAAAEEEQLKKQATDKQERTQLPKKAAHAMEELKSASSRLEAHRDNLPFEVKLASLLYARSIGTNDCVANWPGKIGAEAGKLVSEKDKAATETVGKMSFGAGVRKLFEKCGTTAEREGIMMMDIDATFDAQADDTGALNVKIFLRNAHQAAATERTAEEQIVSEVATLSQRVSKQNARLAALKQQEAEEQRRAAQASAKQKREAEAAEAEAAAARQTAAAEAAERKAKAKREWDAKVQEHREGPLFGAAAHGVKADASFTLKASTSGPSFKDKREPKAVGLGAGESKTAAGVGASDAPASEPLRAEAAAPEAALAAARSFKPQVMEVLMARTRLKMRKSFALDSEHASDLAAGTKVHVLQRQKLADGTIRAQVALRGQKEPAGWVSWLAKDGRENLVVPMVVHEK